MAMEESAKMMERVEGVKAQSQLMEATTTLEKSIAVLDRTLDEVVERLDPVLNPTAPREISENVRAVPEERAQHVKALSMIASLVDEQTDRLRVILQRLAV